MLLGLLIAADGVWAKYIISVSFSHRSGKTVVVFVWSLDPDNIRDCSTMLEQARGVLRHSAGTSKKSDNWVSLAPWVFGSEEFGSRSSVILISHSTKYIPSD